MRRGGREGERNEEQAAAVEVQRLAYARVRGGETGSQGPPPAMSSVSRGRGGRARMERERESAIARDEMDRGGRRRSREEEGKRGEERERGEGRKGGGRERTG